MKIFATALLLSLSISCVIEGDKSFDSKKHSHPDSVLHIDFIKQENSNPSLRFVHVVDESILKVDQIQMGKSINVEFKTKINDTFIFEDDYYLAKVSCADQTDISLDEYNCDTVVGTLANKSSGVVTHFEYQDTGIELDPNSNFANTLEIKHEDLKISVNTSRVNGVPLSRIFSIRQKDSSDIAFCLNYNFEALRKSYCMLEHSPTRSAESEEAPKTRSATFGTSHIDQADSEIFLSLESEHEIIFNFPKPEEASTDQAEEENQADVIAENAQETE